MRDGVLQFFVNLRSDPTQEICVYLSSHESLFSVQPKSFEELPVLPFQLALDPDSVIELHIDHEPEFDFDLQLDVEGEDSEASSVLQHSPKLNEEVEPPLKSKGEGLQSPGEEVELGMLQLK